MRFTLPKLFLVVTMAALACAGMTLRTRGWAEAMVTLTASLFVVMGVLAVGKNGRARASAVAFALIGGAYLLLVTCNTFSPIRDLLLTNRALVLAGEALKVPIEESPASPVAPTAYSGTTTVTTTQPNGTQTLSILPPGTQVSTGTLTLSGGNTLAPNTGSGVLTFSSASSGNSSLSISDDAFGFGSPTPNPQIPAGAFLIIGHCVWSWLLALSAGWLCGAMYAKRTCGAV